MEQNFNRPLPGNPSRRIRRSLLEVACFNPESAIIAARAGADRIELCRDYASGGLSPEPETVAFLKSRLSIPIYAMIRPHANSFYYSDADLEEMKRTMNTFKRYGADGFVFGGLTQSPLNTVDLSRNKELVQLAEGKPCTFHRAFDYIPESDWGSALSDLVNCGFSSILTSGGPSPGAVDSVQQLAALNDRLAQLEGRLECHQQLPQMVVGGGVRSANVEFLWEETNALAYHSAALVPSTELVSEDEVRALKDSLVRAEMRNSST
ncbi:copper homeostasis CutC domain-containing protein [Aspergillus avenaceus]|uniref:Copper homeostasis protein cutC homolog n=1 Tax=Aspergillus avenaceus TaxID=36643 RepID=A0A5N6TZ00_ASPAV|nr:copper homeostasis CutC domain-containing protein [Aspergillus avenaceus]